MLAQTLRAALTAGDACARHRRVGAAGWLALAAVGLVYVAAVLKSLKLRKAKLV